MENAKRVYVLGAGFSHDAGLPLQADILNEIFKLNARKLPLLSSAEGAPDFIAARRNVINFIKNVYPPEVNPSLEDLFTLADQIISQRSCCIGYDAEQKQSVGYSWQHVDNVREQLKQAILFVFHNASDKIERNKPKAAEFYRLLAAQLVRMRLEAGQQEDPFSIISLNWDCLLEESIYWCLKRAGAERKVDIDYCCYTNPLSSSCPHSPSLLQKTRGLYNIKILKLHGSTNWLLCPNCSRLYTGVGDSGTVWSMYVEPKYCSVCRKRIIKSNTSEGRSELFPKLEPFFITPTFAKVFDNTHIQMTWHNAHVELTEAKEVVFIGYSLPESDYHFRTLLKRSINSDASIVVVLTRRDSSRGEAQKQLQKYLPRTRYENFFGKDKVKFKADGVRRYFSAVMRSRNLSSAIKALKRKIKK